MSQQMEGTRMGFFDDVDRLVAKHERTRNEARAELKRCGWRLLRQHPYSGMWRAARHTKQAGTKRLHAPTAEQLITLAQEEAEPRLAARAERAARKAEEKKRAKVA